MGPATSREQRERFLKAVVSAEARAYSRAVRPVWRPDADASAGSRTRPNGVSVVDSKLNQTNGQPINIQWEVRDAGQGLRITDVKIEGVSMVMTRRSDFNSYIQSHGGKVEPLIDELEAKSSAERMNCSAVADAAVGNFRWEAVSMAVFARPDRTVEGERHG